jgi:pyruvate dehydrogenase E2 component (dihydrolipoamide acetyltransferase)
VETDKAAVDVEAEASGILQGLRFAPGDQVPVGETMAWIAAPGEVISPITPPSEPASTEPSDSTQPAPDFQTEPPRFPPPQTAGRTVASPVAKRIAKEHGIDLQQVRGRGPHGRITKADVEAYLAQHAAIPVASVPLGEVPYAVVSLSNLRQRTGERMLTSVRTAPHFDLEVDVNMCEAGRWRARYAEGSGGKVSYTTLLVKVVAQALRAHLCLNAAWVDGELRVYREINIGVAMATADGLVVPVVGRADEMSLSQIQETITRLREKAERLRFAPDDVRGGTFTVSNLGMYGVDAFRAIINPPQAAILATGRIVERPVGVEGKIVLRPVMRLVLSIDHRVADGAQAAPFVVAVRRYIENPYLLL